MTFDIRLHVLCTGGPASVRCVLNKSSCFIGFQFLFATGLRCARELRAGLSSAPIFNIFQKTFTYNFQSFPQVGFPVLTAGPVVEVEKISALSSFLVTAKHQRRNISQFYKANAHSDWLWKPSTSSRDCTTVSNSSNPSGVFISVYVNAKNVFYCLNRPKCNFLKKFGCNR